MDEVSLSVVIPVFNEAAHLAETIDALATAADGSGFEPEIIVVDDGSTDGTATVARASTTGDIPLHVITQENSGRFAARRRGLEMARGEWVLLLDGRVLIDAGALAYVHDRLRNGADVWASHVEIKTDGNVYAIFWKLLAELAWSDYFDHPREVSFRVDEFDRFPKGTTCFFAPRQLVLDAVQSFRSRYSDLRHANDDTPLLRRIAERRPIHVSPQFCSTYRPRTTLTRFVRHAFHRGVVFVDGHGRPESRFFPIVVAFYPASVALTLAILRRPRLVPLALVATGVAAGAYGVARRRNASEIAALAVATPPYAFSHGAGMWRGLVRALTER